MSSESFRNEFISRLLNVLPSDQVSAVLTTLDETVSHYDIEPKHVSLTVPGGTPEVVKYYLVSKSIGNMSQKTLYIYRLRLEHFFSIVKKPFSDITSGDIRGYMGYCKTQMSASDSYLDNIRRILNAFFSWLVANEYLIRNPCASVEPVKHQAAERIPLTPYELEVLRWYCKTIREKALVDFLYSTGVRISECHDVSLSDIDWNCRSVIIRHGKGNKRRIVYFNAESELTLRKYLDSRDDSNPALFVTSRNPHTRLGVRSLETEIAKVSSRCDMHVYPHKLRHTFATSGIRGGMPLDKLQALMGHAKPETTLIYAKIDTSSLQMEHSRIYA